MSDWRKIETVLAGFFRDAGFALNRGGDCFAEMRGACFLAQAGERCPGIYDREINLTKLAHAIAESAS